MKLNKLKEKYPKIIKEVRGKGLLIGLCLYKDQTNFIKKLLDNKLLTSKSSRECCQTFASFKCHKTRNKFRIKNNR